MVETFGINLTSIVIYCHYKNNNYLLNIYIDLQSISPGVVDTEFKEGYPDSTKEAITAAPSLSANDVADAVIYVLSTGPNVEIRELTIRPLGEAI